MRTLRAVAATSLLLSLALPALAQRSNKVAAEALFEEGRKLMAAKRPGEACPKFAESNRLDPAAGTLLNLGACYEAAGKLASAWSTYKEAGSLAQTTGRTELVATAKKRADKLDARLIRLRVEAAEQADLVVKRDGAEVARAELGVPIPVDPGDHVVTAAAPGKRPFTATVQAKDEGSTLSVKVPVLEADPAAIAPPAPATSAPPAAPPASSAAAPPPPPPAEAGGGTQRTIGWVAGGVGVVGLAAGTLFALSARSKYSSSKDLCRPDDPNRCTQAGVDARDAARSRGNVATALFAVGVIGVGAGAALVLTAPSEKGAVRVSPALGGVVVDGSF
ncbi:MAG: hypothetical protein IT374_23910 [Polyangiaceae bacterium]|nr:hypothetical protein [Polyangiaceae bacterium]